jgi:large subunit ribosomal protein L25
MISTLGSEKDAPVQTKPNQAHRALALTLLHYIHTKVPLHFINAESSPAVKLSAAVVTHVVTEIEIECLPSMLPQFIEVDLALTVAGDAIHLLDIKLPVGVKYVSHGGDENPLIASVNVPAAKKGDEEATDSTTEPKPEA